jgi:hypothetical protein
VWTTIPGIELNAKKPVNIAHTIVPQKLDFRSEFHKKYFPPNNKHKNITKFVFQCFLVNVMLNSSWNQSMGSHISPRNFEKYIKIAWLLSN